MATPGVGSIVVTGQAPFATQPARGALTSAVMTALGSATGSALGAVELLPISAEANASNGSVAFGELVLEEVVASGKYPDTAVLVMEKMIASGTAIPGTAATATLQLDPITATSVAGSVGMASGDAILQPMLAAATAAQVSIATAAATLRRVQASGTAVSGTLASGALVLQQLETVGTAAPLPVATGAMAMSRLFVSGYSEPVIAQTYRTWVMNTANEALTEYTNSPFNSYASFNGAIYAAGPTGLFTISGEDDNGTNIGWAIRTGFHDDKNTFLKGLSEILMSVRFDGPIRVKIWTDEATSYQYTLVNFRNDVLHQVRLPTGKGMRSRYYRVELSGMNGAACELESLQIPMEPVKRRVG